MSNIEDKIIDGLTAFGEQSGDVGLAQAGASIYRAVADAFQNIRPDDSCTLAFPAMIIRPDIRTDALAAIFSSHAVIAWRKGLLKKKTEHVAIPLASIQSASSYLSNKPSMRGARLLEIKASETTTLALPKDNGDVADIIKEAFLTKA